MCPTERHYFLPATDAWRSHDGWYAGCGLTLLLGLEKLMEAAPARCTLLWIVIVDTIAIGHFFVRYSGD
ncbi:MAG: hypothetical protein H8E44_01150 [Planctomycetes bacterium]|nr:hypothetical protein [Planctomycetota bacterium]MBL7044490.1 hypothetical protein [Pirellulaceae bacterium]